MIIEPRKDLWCCWKGIWITGRLLVPRLLLSLDTLYENVSSPELL